MKYNYAFLAGFLESELKNLAYDEKFRNFKSVGYRLDYVQKIINNAMLKAAVHENHRPTESAGR